MWLLGFLGTSVGMLVGGSFAYLFKKLHQKISTLYAGSAGLILGLISIEILPEAIDLGGWFISIMGLIIGMLTFEFLHNILLHRERFKIKSKEKVYNRVGLLVMLSISIHNLPMGLMLGASHNDELREKVLLTIFLHSIPEGIILFIPLICRSINLLYWLSISFLISTPVIVGVFIGNLIGFEYKQLIALIVSFTAGNLLMVIVKEYLFIAFKNLSTWIILLLFFIGFAIMCLYLHLV